MSRRYIEKGMGVSLNDKQNLLLDHFSNLTAIDQKPFLFFAEFLYSRNEYADAMQKTHQIPELLPRPVGESVPKAIKRLSLSYPMLQDAELLHQYSTLMSDSS